MIKQLFLLFVMTVTVFFQCSDVKGQRLHTKKILTYNLSVPLGSTRNFIERASFRGATLEIREMMGDDKFSLGISAGWHVFDKVVYDTYTEENTSISGKQYRTINAIPILITYHRYNGEETGLRTFVGGGLGMEKIIHSMEVGSYALVDRQWHFALAPEAGIIYPINERYSLLGSLKFNYAFKGTTSDGISYLGLNAGVIF